MRPSGELITRDDVLAARARIQGYVRRTPLLPPGAPSHPLWLKCEFLQYTGTFKTRGAFNRQLAARERGELDPTIGIVVASGGNAGLANAYAAAALGVRATVFVPETAPPIKIERILEYNARVRQVGAEYAEAYEAAVDYANTRGALLCHAYDQLEIAAGAGTLAEEILEDEPAIDTIVVAVGGGGLFAGVAADLHSHPARGARRRPPGRCGRVRDRSRLPRCAPGRRDSLPHRLPSRSDFSPRERGCHRRRAIPAVAQFPDRGRARRCRGLRRAHRRCIRTSLRRKGRGRHLRCQHRCVHP